ncbi:MULTISPECIES: ABC transporter permease [Flavobacterium]|uniref:ABC transporter permease n=1 Tax=Flavobacterium jumunjinense TaxID=998845 RepID=A0ABV5GML7_9FLAO|nr:MULTISPECIES: ABC transporter permease [Flavobacterium]
MKEYFELQIRMMNRHLSEFGIPPILVYGCTPFLFFYASNELFSRTDYATFFYLFLGLSLIFQLGEKKKNDFLKFTFSKTDYFKIRIAENSLILIPFIFFLIYKEYFITAFLLFVLGFILALMTYENTFNVSIKTPFFKHPFEFCIGFRKTFSVFILAYFLTFMSIRAENLNLGFFSILMVQFICLNFYTKPESAFYVWIYSMSPKEFIFYKFKIIVLYSTLLCLPIVIALCLFFQNEIITIVGILCLSYFFILTGMLAKYAAYPDAIFIREGVVLAFLVWFPPILVLILPYLYVQSIKKLNDVLV